MIIYTLHFKKLSPNVPAVTDVFLRPIRKNAQHFYGRKKMWLHKTPQGAESPTGVLCSLAASAAYSYSPVICRFLSTHKFKNILSQYILFLCLYIIIMLNRRICPAHIALVYRLKRHKNNKTQKAVRLHWLNYNCFK
jgi:hypothetical protein